MRRALSVITYFEEWFRRLEDISKDILSDAGYKEAQSHKLMMEVN